MLDERRLGRAVVVGSVFEALISRLVVAERLVNGRGHTRHIAANHVARRSVDAGANAIDVSEHAKFIRHGWTKLDRGRDGIANAFEKIDLRSATALIWVHTGAWTGIASADALVGRIKERLIALVVRIWPHAGGGRTEDGSPKIPQQPDTWPRRIVRH